MSDPAIHPLPAAPQLDGQAVDMAQLIAKAAQAAADKVASQKRDLVAPEDGEAEESISYVANGWIRCVIGGVRHRLRRPLFGELKKLRINLEAQQDELTALRQGIELSGNQRGKMVAALEAKMVAVQGRMETEELTDELLAEHRALIERKHALVAEATVDSRKLMHAADDLREVWFALVFETLGVDTPKAPGDWPSWIADSNVPAEFMAHWRSVPLGHGPR